MIRNYIERFDEEYYEEVLDNGLEVIIYPKKEFKTSACVLGVNFGALDIHQIVDNHEERYHSGVAHFLEHKLFESNDHDVMLDFTAMGANVNAFTSYDCTCYYFTTTAKNIINPLNLLLDFVLNFHITQKSVDKEKNIIIQELLMYQQMADFRVLFETYKGMYHDFPMKYDIAGTKDDVNDTTADELMKIYNINYDPKRMKLIIVTGQDVNEIIEDLRNHEAIKRPYIHHDVQSIYDESKDEVVRKYNEVKMDVASDKICIGYKLKNKSYNNQEFIKNEWAYQIILDYLFTSMNERYQSWLDEKIINDYFSSEVEYGKGYAHILFVNEKNNPEEIDHLVKTEFERVLKEGIDKNKLNQLKNRSYGLAFKVFNDVESLAINHMRYAISGLKYEDVVEMILNIDEEFILNCIKDIDFENKSITCISSNLNTNTTE